MTARPSGTVTFLITDIEQSTKRWDEAPAAMREALAAHDAVLRSAIESNGGWLFKHTGDGVIAAFGSARAATDAAIAAQRKLALPVRMGICTGEAEARDNDYFGPALNRAARTMTAGHGGQVLVAQSTAALLHGVELADLGEHRLRDLSERQRLYQLHAEGLKSEFPPLRTLDATLGNLPAQTTSFLGRDKALAEVTALVRAARVVTLTGVGGVGKTRLAVQAAGELAPEFADGAWLVEFAAVGDPAAAGHAVAGVLGVAQQPGKTIAESVVAALQGRRLLLVLDNCEHLIEAAANLAHDIAAHCAGVKLLATSREALMVEGERNWPVPSLAVGGGIDAPAAALFVERARAVAPEFMLGGEAAAAVSEICRRLDGIPLAIELAAARIRTMSPAQIRDRLDERFRLLTGGSRRGLERHQTLRHAVQWSFDLLTPAERAVLARASVFAGGFTLEAAESICAGKEVEAHAMLDLLDSLVRKSLVIVERRDENVRYGMLETIRQFGEEQLAAMGESDALRRGHAAYFARDSAAQFAAWLSPRQLSAYHWLDREMDNLRAAFRWSAERGEVDFAAGIASNIGDMARFRLREEAANWASEIIAEARRVRHRRLAVLLTWAASSAWGFGHLEEAKRYGEEAIALAGNPDFDPFVWAYADLAFVAAYEGDLQRALALIRAGADQAADQRDRFCWAFLPYIASVAGQADAAIAMAADVVAPAEATGIPSSILVALYSKGYALAKSEPEAALAAYERMVALAHVTGNRLWENLAAPGVAALRGRSGDPAAALTNFARMLAGWRGATDLLVVSHGFGGLIVLFERLGRLPAAALLYGMVARAFQSNPFVQELPATMSRVRERLGDAAYDEMNRRGAAMAVNEAIDYAQDQIREALSERDFKP